MDPPRNRLGGKAAKPQEAWQDAGLFVKENLSGLLVQFACPVSFLKLALQEQDSAKLHPRGGPTSASQRSSTASATPGLSIYLSGRLPQSLRKPRGPYWGPSVTSPGLKGVAMLSQGLL